MSGCLLNGCRRHVAAGDVLCAWHASQTPPALFARLMTAATTKVRAAWGLGGFRKTTACTREAASSAFADAAAAVRSWWAGERVQ